MATKTYSLPAAAFAVAQGQPIPDLDTANPERFQFCFADPNAAALIKDYFRGVEVPARDFYAALCELRRAMAQAKGGAR